MNLYLDPVTNDLQITAGRNLRLTETDTEELSQRLEVRLALFQTEWYLDRNFGVPYYERILKKQADVNEVQAILTGIILNTPGVADIISFDVTYEADTRKYNVDFVVQKTDGEEIEGGVAL